MVQQLLPGPYLDVKAIGSYRKRWFFQRAKLREELEKALPLSRGEEVPVDDYLRDVVLSLQDNGQQAVLLVRRDRMTIPGPLRNGAQGLKNLPVLEDLFQRDAALKKTPFSGHSFQQAIQKLAVLEPTIQFGAQECMLVDRLEQFDEFVAAELGSGFGLADQDVLCGSLHQIVVHLALVLQIPERLPFLDRVKGGLRDVDMTPFQ